MPDTQIPVNDRQSAVEQDAPRVRIYRNPHRWMLLTRIDLSQDQAEAYALHHAGVVPDVAATEVIGPCCVVCEADWHDAPATCAG
jgi:hypothetical protein